MSDQDPKKMIQRRAVCLACDKKIGKPTEENVMGDQFICGKCREEMISSLDEAWTKYSAFLDAALN